jgi:hypothetical protein
MTHHRTLHIRLPLGQTFALALLILALVTLVGEAFARVVLPHTDLPTAIGSQNPTFDQKIGMLDRLADEAGGVDCIFLGSSVVLNGLDPAAFSAAYAAQTGQAITCYNFGVPALTARTAGVLAEFLVERYQPGLLVYGFTLRALAADVPQADEVYSGIVETPWFEYKRGSVNVRGWLVEHSTAYRYYLALRNWITPLFTNELRQHIHAPDDGYEPFHSFYKLDPARVHVPDYFARYTTAPDAWAGLEKIVALHGDTQVLLLDMPLPDFLRAQFDGGADAYQAVVDEVGAYAQARGVTLLSTNPLDLIPGDDWAEDGQHVNHQGAQILSRWVGEQVGQMRRAS